VGPVRDRDVHGRRDILVLTLQGVAPFAPDKGAILNAIQVRDTGGGGGGCHPRHPPGGRRYIRPPDTDVATNGTLVYAYDAVHAAGTITVNGVPFTNVNNSNLTQNITLDWNITVDNLMNSSTGFGAWSGLSATYRALLGMLLLPLRRGIVKYVPHNLISGHNYLIQVWDATSNYAEVRGR